MSNTKLFEEFASISAEQWVQQAVKDLKGESFDEKLKYTTPDGISVNPFYTSEDLEKYKDLKPLFAHANWEVCQEIEVAVEKDANKKALNMLNNGATALLFFAYNTVDLEKLLNEIQIEFIHVHFVIEGNARIFSEKLIEYCKSKNLDVKNLNITINIDPIENLLRTGDWRKSLTEDKAELLSIYSSTNSLRTISINSNIYHNAGATEAYELGCTLAHANEYINWAIENKIELKSLNKKFQINLAVGPNYFFEIAKLRALRKTFAILFKQYNIDPEIYIHAETAFRNITVYDAYNNLLRTTTEAMSASIGGCNSLVVKPFDTAFESANDFSERLSRNIQLILKSESYFDKVADVSAGSYFIEELTEQIGARAWEYFKEIETAGGLIASLEKGIIQNTVSGFAKIQQTKFNAGIEVLVGTNKFPNAKEMKSEKSGSIYFGSSNDSAKTIVPLNTERIAAGNERARIENEN